MKQEEGFVLKLDGDTALVQVGRHESCESCGACAAAEGPQTVVAENPISAKPDSMSDSRCMRKAS